MKVYQGWVKTNEDEFYIQLADCEARFGFVLCDDEQSWDVPPFENWEPVSSDTVPNDRREELQYLLDENNRNINGGE
jgi:hypothetical protein